MAPPAPWKPILLEHSLMMRAANWSPTWREDAALAAKLYAVEAGTVVDGVVHLDPTAQAYLLQVTGPIAVPEYGETIDSVTLF